MDLENLTEKELEEFIYGNPEVIERGLKPVHRQYSIENRRIDLIFEDSLNRKLLIELKKGEIRRTDIGQLLEYYGIVCEKIDDIRLMLVCRSVPIRFKNALEKAGLEWREFKDLGILDSNSNDKLISRAKRESNTGNYNLALTYAKKALNADPKSTPALKVIVESLISSYDLKEAENYLIKAKHLEGETDEILVLEGILQIAKKNLKEASVSIDKALKINPDSTEAYRIKGYISAENREIDNAFDYYTKSLEKDPYNLSTLLDKGCLLINQGKEDIGIEYINKALGLDNTNTRALATKAMFYEKTGFRKEAIKLVDKAIALNPKCSVAWSTKAVILAKRGRKRDIGDALQAADMALKLDPMNENAQRVKKHLTSKSNCFIATAAYGTPFASEINVLRCFRDNFLLQHKLGECLVEIYYQLSPPIANFISKSEALKFAVRSILKPVILLLKFPTFIKQTKK
jgi:tetratricopeptide (TPR) repeat protein